jgi:hypothetical protein
MTLAEVQKGYRDDGDGDGSMSQRQQQQQAPQLSQERQLLQAAAMIHTALMLVSGWLLPREINASRPQPGVNFADAKLTPCGRNH